MAAVGVRGSALSAESSGVRLFSLVVIALIVMLVGTVKACQFENSPAVVLNKKSISYVPICIIMNDQSLFYTEVKFDILTRVVLKNSFARVTSSTACSDPLFFPLGCPASGVYPGSGFGTGPPTNFYVNVMGIPALYKKRYAILSSSQGGSVSSVFPIVTLVVQVDGGKVKKVYWDDGCYFNEGSGAATTSYTMLNCRPNAFDLLSNNQSSPQALNPTGKAPPFTGYDCSLTTPACKTGLGGQTLPGGFCDLGIYVVWTGTSADGQQLTSAGQRFRRFRSYAMNNQYLTMLNFSGHFLPEPVT